MKAQSFWAKCSFYTATERSDKKDFAINGFFCRFIRSIEDEDEENDDVGNGFFPRTNDNLSPACHLNGGRGTK